MKTLSEKRQPRLDTGEDATEDLADIYTYLEKDVKKFIKKITNTIKDWYWCNAHDRGLMEDIVEMIKEKAGKELVNLEKKE
jgi:hypothetical protein